MGFRPLPRKENIESTLIWYKNGDSKDIEHWVKSMTDFVARKYFSCILSPYLKFRLQASKIILPRAIEFPPAGLNLKPLKNDLLK